MRLYAAVAILLVLGSAAVASIPTDFAVPMLPAQENSVPVSLRVIDQTSNNPLSGYFVYCRLVRDDKNRARFEGYSDEKGGVSFNADEGIFTTVCTADGSSTPALDYSMPPRELDFSKRQDYDLFLYPVGTVIGTVRSNGSLIDGADVTINCASRPPEWATPNTTSNSFGGFTLLDVPTGNCVISARRGNLVATYPVTVSRGEAQTARIELSEQVLQLESDKAKWSGPAAYAALAIALAVLAAGVWYLVRQRNKAQLQAVPTRASGKPRLVKASLAAKPASRELSADARMRTVMQTLDERERQVVAHLLQQGGACRESAVRKALLIPKASFFRLIIRLKSRAIVDVEKFENRAMLKLTDWFLSGKENGQE